MQLIAMTSTERDADVVKQHAILHRKAMGLDSEQSVLDAARVHYEQLIADYNRTTPQMAAQQANLFASIDALTKELMDRLSAHVGAEMWKAIGRAGEGVEVENALHRRQAESGRRRRTDTSGLSSRRGSCARNIGNDDVVGQLGWLYLLRRDRYGRHQLVPDDVRFTEPAIRNGRAFGINITASGSHRVVPRSTAFTSPTRSTATAG